MRARFGRKKLHVETGRSRNDEKFLAGMRNGGGGGDGEYQGLRIDDTAHDELGGRRSPLPTRERPGIHTINPVHPW